MANNFNFRYTRRLVNGVKFAPSETRVKSREIISNIINGDDHHFKKLDDIIDYFKMNYEGRYKGLSRKERFDVFVRYEGKCMWCKRPIPIGEMTIEHILPLVEGGDYDIDNLGCACGPCNNLRSDTAIQNGPIRHGHLQKQYVKATPKVIGEKCAHGVVGNWCFKCRYPMERKVDGRWGKVEESLSTGD